ncbi:dATP/dGTP diphosphohydrolase domain-containing protein [Flavobacterium sp.]|uniref:dATP/dGTP diphosphohydrolase domain-containing protein n=1 Tax=Flavobacterium sp. TaxID=239 RepID=UPI0038FCC32D
MPEHYDPANPTHKSYKSMMEGLGKKSQPVDKIEEPWPLSKDSYVPPRNALPPPPPPENNKEEIRKFESGAIRDSENGKEDYIETISWIAFRRYAQYMTKCKEKYGAGNFKKSIPIDSYECSLVRHLQKYLANKYESQDIEKESCHLCAMLFNIFGILHEEETAKIRAVQQK